MQPDLFTEEWRPIPGSGGSYEVSSLGRMRSVDRVVQLVDGRRRIHSGQILKQTLDVDGYFCCKARVDGVIKKVVVHRIVTRTFHGEKRPDQEACHIDGNRLNNRADNLRWGTKSENAEDRVRHGTDRNARKTHCPSGHEYSPENTVRIPSRPTARYCAACQRIRNLARSERNRRRRMERVA